MDRFRQLSARFARRMSQPVSGASLAIVRICFGLVMCYESLWFLGLTPNAQHSPNRIELLFTGDHVRWTFPFSFFSWVQPLPEPWTTAVFVVMAAAALLVVLGVFYRVAIVAVFLAFTYAQLMEAAAYLNHFYLASLIAFLLCWMPADRRLALRLPGLARQRTADSDPPPVPFWTLFLLRSQLLLVYFLAGVAKLNPDWLVGEPVRIWLRHSSVGHRIEPLLSAESMESLRHFLAGESIILGIAYVGLVFDLLIGPLLIWRRTRLPALATVLVFHGINFCLFDIGAFPVMAAGLTLVFLDPDWPVRLARAVTRRSKPRGRSSDVAAVAAPTRWSPAAVGVVCWLLLQSIIPLRHYIISGDPSWTDEGHRYSWHMMLRSKDAGRFFIEVADPQLGTPAVEKTDWFDDGLRFKQVAADSVRWDEQSDIVVTYEPWLGERIFLNPLADRDWYQVAARARSHWLREYGRAPDFKRTASLEIVLKSLIAEAQASRARDPAARQVLSQLRLAERQRQVMLSTETSRDTRDQATLHLQATLQRLLEHRHWRKRILSRLIQTPPFACQGAQPTSVPFMVIVSRELQRADADVAMRIDRDKWRGTDQVLIDSGRLMPRAWRSLPQVVRFDSFVDDRPAMLWNFAAELSTLQIRSLQVSPLLQYQYAQHIAATWQERFGRRPEVYVTSHVQLNHHQMQPIVNSQVDLASVRWKMLRHNEWILPLERKSAQQPGEVAAK